MKNSIFNLVTSSILILMSLSSQANQDMERKMNNEELKVLSTIKNMTAAFESGNIDGVLETYEKNAKVIFQPDMHISSKKQLQEVFQEAAGMKPEFEYFGHEVFIADDMAIHIAPWEMTVNAPDGTKTEQDGLSIAVLRHQDNGEWLMVLDNPNGDNLIKVKQDSKPSLNDEEKKIHTTIENMTTAFESGNIDGVLKTYEKTAMVIFQPDMHVS